MSLTRLNEGIGRQLMKLTWVEHIGPVWKKNMSWMQQALINWNRAMEEAGLTETSTQAMDNFVRDGMRSPQ
jgi:hypothetical protein